MINTILDPISELPHNQTEYTNSPSHPLPSNYNCYRYSVEYDDKLNIMFIYDIITDYSKTCYKTISYTKSISTKGFYQTIESKSQVESTEWFSNFIEHQKFQTISPKDLDIELKNIFDSIYNPLQMFPTNYTGGELE